MSIDRQTQALLDLVAADRAQKCDAILAEARAKADALLRAAHTDARERMRRAFREERERGEARVGAARANLQTRRRLALQQRSAALLAAASTRLPLELVRRWQAPATRRAWVATIMTSALGLLPRTAPWQIVHPPDWPDSERDATIAELVGARGVAPTCIPDERLRAGLRISANGNVIDGTLDGLLADRADIGGHLLHLLEAEVDR